jgi:hemolysin III
MHQWAAAAMLVPAFVLWRVASTWWALVSSLVFVVGIGTTFTVSALYHRLPHATERARAMFRSADHATIFVGIAGSYTPVCALAVPTALGVPLLIGVWLGAGFGAICALSSTRWCRIVHNVMYIALGWVGIVALPSLISGPGWHVALWVIAGGLLYTVGAVLFARQAPRLSPRTFGYHEVWHTFTVAAAGCHFVAVLQLV